ncbi:nitroreductase family protein [Halorussus halophilus]|uniref:nitroreductase family protein n=1 Tax=Halorussus halophilus TaxID=2650975 RepID=UPI0013016732|nr:nitroreductase family protein [Halorussus halophilus]
MSQQLETDDYDVDHDAEFPGVIEAIRTRRSGHNFDAEAEISDETLEALVEDAALAPSSYNLQPWEFVAVQDGERLDEVVELAYGQEHIKDAGTAILVVGHSEAETADRVFGEWEEAGRMDEQAAEETKATAVGMYDDERMGRDYGIRNASLAAENLMLSAHARGLKATPMIGFDAEGLSEFLELPDDKIPVMLVAVGESGGEEPERLPRRGVEEVLHRESY